MKRKPAPKKKPSRPMPPDPPHLTPDAAMAATALARADRAARGARTPKAIADDRNLHVNDRRKAAARLAKLEYVTDPEQGSLQAHYERADRPYRELWPKFSSFDAVAKREDWAGDRERHWDKITHSVQQQILRADARAFLDETRRLGESLGFLTEYMSPLRDASGEVRRHDALTADNHPHPYAGLPIFPLEMPPLDKFVPVYLKMLGTLQTYRSTIAGKPALGEPGSDNASAIGGGAPGKVFAPPQHVVDEIARALVRHGTGDMSEFTSGDNATDTEITDEEVHDGFGEDGARSASDARGEAL